MIRLIREQHPLPFVILIAWLLCSRCANPVSPTGGPKDTEPPVNERCIPPDLTTHFDSKLIRMDFDEFFQLKDPNSQIMISPPWLPETDYRIRGKSLFVILEDTLQANTTYTLNFGDAIADISEGNILRNFKYVFSTGSYIDSMSLGGIVKDAFTLVPEKDVLVMLYLNNNDTVPFDSLPYKVKPFYMTRTDDNGNFSLTNLSDTSFKLFALKDINSNFIYDLPDEKIAFEDSLVKSIYSPPPAPPDTAARDSLKIDSLAAPSAVIKQMNLFMFQQFDSVQQVMRSELLQEGQIGIYFRYPLKEHLFRCLNSDSISNWYLEELNRSRDSVFLWIREFPKDSLILQITEQGTIVDTLEFDLVWSKGKNKPGKKEQPAPKRLTVKSSAQGRFLNQFKSDLMLTFSYPLVRFDLHAIRLVEGEDTLKPSVSSGDSLHRTLVAKNKWKEDKKYKVILPDSAFFGITGLTNDSLILVFSTKAEKEFGFLKMNITKSDTSSQVIVQMLNEKDQVLDHRILTGSEVLKFAYLNPQKYKFKAIIDKNRNGRWDTGDYLKNRQPEDVVIFPKVIEIRANWELEEDWNL